MNFVAFIEDFAIWQVLNDARKKFTQEISFQAKDKDISLAKVFTSVAHLFLFKAFSISRSKND